MAAYGLLLALAGDCVLAHFNEQEKAHLWRWLQQSEAQAIPDNNWHFFPILVQVGFHHAGMPTNPQVREAHFNAMERYYRATAGIPMARTGRGTITFRWASTSTG